MTIGTALNCRSLALTVRMTDSPLNRTQKRQFKIPFTISHLKSYMLRVTRVSSDLTIDTIMSVKAKTLKRH